MSARERLIAVALAMIVAAMITGIKCVHVGLLQGDTAAFLQAAESAATDGRAESQVFAGTQAYLDARYARKSPAVFATDPLAPPAIEERSFVRYHADFVLYPLGFIAKVFPTLLVLLTVCALSFVGLVLLAYWALRRARVPVPASLLFCALIVAAPAWSQGSLFGQFFPDRMFLAVGFAFMLCIGRSGSSRLAQILLGVLCLLINERAALTAGGFALLYAGLYRNIPSRERIFKAALGGALVTYGLVMIVAVLNDHQYGVFLPTSVDRLVATFSRAGFVEMAGLYLLVCMPFLILAAFDWRAGVIALVMMLPNILGNYGGAEKLAWPVHYHSYDFPTLVWAAMTGFICGVRIVPATRRGLYYATPAVLAAFLIVLDPNSYDHLQISPAEVGSSFFAEFPREAIADLSPSGLEAVHLGDPLRATIPVGATATTVEGAMSQLYRGRTLRIFPIGIDQADYAVVNDYGPSVPAMRYRGTPHFGPPAVAHAVDAVIYARMKRDGYDFAHAVEVPALGLAIVKRVSALRAAIR
ncbi:MAG TPA: hypothetical protein VGD50_06130 [Candidatus Baltobacteraceae bacterium]